MPIGGLNTKREAGPKTPPASAAVNLWTVTDQLDTEELLTSAGPAAAKSPEAFSALPSPR